MLCHCSVCKRLTGSVFAMHYPVAGNQFAITSAARPKVHAFTHPTGLPLVASFCPDCGTWLYKQVEAEAAPMYGFFLVQAGTTDLPPGATEAAEGHWAKRTPAVEIWVSERAPWLAPVDGAEQKAQF
jgi:hypothetical protein